MREKTNVMWAALKISNERRVKHTALRICVRKTNIMWAVLKISNERRGSDPEKKSAQAKRGSLFFRAGSRLKFTVVNQAGTVLFKHIRHSPRRFTPEVSVVYKRVPYFLEAYSTFTAQSHAWSLLILTSPTPSFFVSIFDSTMDKNIWFY